MESIILTFHSNKPDQIYEVLENDAILKRRVQNALVMMERISKQKSNRIDPLRATLYDDAKNKVDIIYKI